MHTCLDHGPRSSHDGAYAGEQLAEPERLDDVVVRSQFEAENTIDLLATSGDDDDRYVRARTELTTHVGAVDIGQTEVEKYEVGALRRERIATRRDAIDLEPFTAKALRQRARDRVLVFDDQDSHMPIVASGGVRAVRGKPNDNMELEMIYLRHTRG